MENKNNHLKKAQPYKKNSLQNSRGGSVTGSHIAKQVAILFIASTVRAKLLGLTIIPMLVAVQADHI
ncbi:hypothetical protein [Flavobacterium sp. PL002]|uniref:hypothetical protein n=1 Tax=Flavobacterium sp. PL002 TaxID=1897058 RepID=UPI0017888ADC|nr:hypothetical protein [Flavobacterium sp. PL002]